MTYLKWIIVTMALLLGGWLTFDGTRAWIVGDFITPSSGPYAGQLGPWSKVVQALGLDPRGRFVKSLHIGLCVAWLAAGAVFILRPAAGWWCLMVCAVGTLWYIPIGTVISILVLVTLWIHR